MFKATKKPPQTDLNSLPEGIIRGRGFSMDQLPPHEPQDTSAAYITIQTDTNEKVQLYIRESRFDYATIRLYYRFIKNDEVTEWRLMVGDSLELNELLEQKEQLLESTRDTVTIEHGDNGTNETTKVDVNFEKVQGKLTAGAGINLSDNTISLLHVDETTVDCNNIITTQYLKPGLGSTNLPNGVQPYGILSVVRIGDVVEQTYQTYTGDGRYIRTGYRVNANPTWTPWREQVGDKSVIDAAINANTEKINQLTARLTALEEKVAQLHPGS